MWLDVVLVLGVVALAVLLGSVAIRNSDIWLHLATGRAISDGSYQIGVDPFCYSTSGETWINPSWLFDWGVFQVFDRFGGSGLVAMRAAMVVLIGIAMLAVKRPGSGWAWPAIGAALALVAANPRLIVFQPQLSSFLNLALLMLVLQLGDRFRKRWLIPTLVGLIQIHWVNHDGWFLLGPITVGLWLIGSLMQRRNESEPPLSVWLVTFVVSLVACLANPHFIKVFVLPDDLVPSFFDETIRNDSLFVSYMAGPFDRLYLSRGPIAPTFTFMGLLSLGAASFIVNISSRPWRRLLIWLALAFLASWRARCIPFFAVGATSLAILNIQEWLSRFSLSGGFISLLGRCVAMIAIGLACFAAFPGWLGPRADDPARMVRFNPKLEPDRALEVIGSQVREWAKTKQLTNSDRSFSPAIEVAHYLAWFDPQQRSFLDSRWRLFEKKVPDFFKVRDILNNLAEGRPADFAPMNQVFDANSVTFLIINGGDRGESVGAARVFWTIPDQWPMWALAGRATVFGRDGKRSSPQLEVGRRAFEPQAAAPHRPPTLDEPPPPTFWNRYLNRIPLRSIDLETSLSWIEYAGVASALQQRDMLAAQIWGATSSAGMGSIASLGLSFVDPFEFMRLMVQGISASRLWKHDARDAEAISASILALRAARAAQIQTPDDPVVYFALAQCYQQISLPQQMGQLCIAAAWTQVQDRIPHAKALGRFYADAALSAAGALADFHLAGLQPGRITNRGHADLAAAAIREWLSLMPQARSTFLSQQHRDQIAQSRRQQLELLEKDLVERRRQFETQATKQTPLARFRLAARFQLHGEAIEIMKSILDGGANANLTTADVAQYIELLLLVGRAEDARKILMLPQFNLPTAIEPPMLQPEFQRLHIWAATACGDVGRARDELPRYLNHLKAVREQAVRESAGSVVGMVVMADPLAAPLLSLSLSGPFFVAAPQSMWTIIGQEFEYRAWDGFLALEEGDTRAAKRAFDDARSGLPPGVRIATPNSVDLYWQLLNRFER